MKLLHMTALLALVALVGACDNTREEVMVEGEPGRQLTGVVRSDSGGPEGAITGWVVVEEGTGNVVPVDFATIIEQAQMMSGNRVIVTGEMMQRPQADGSSKDVFVAKSILLAQP